MDRKYLSAVLREGHSEFLGFIGTLTRGDFEKRKGDKWTTGQQLDHIIKSVAPLAAVLPQKEYLQERFGNSGRASVPYETLVDNYRQTLLEGGKATGAFLPRDIPWEERDAALKHLEGLVGQVLASLGDYTEEEMDRLCLPHPLMGLLTVREMLYFTRYHVGHHLEQVKKM